MGRIDVQYQGFYHELFWVAFAWVRMKGQQDIGRQISNGALGLHIVWPI